MANEVKYYDTAFTYVSPIRYFKANDPYYYEVDNIPIKQLEESQKFLKDQVDGIITKQNNKKEIEIDRSNFSELRPFALGTERKVRVKPGRYTARINNAYDFTPLQVVTQVGGFSNGTQEGSTGGEVISDLNTYRVQTNLGAYAQQVLDEFRKGRLGDALNMNGLAERAFVFPFADEDGLSYPGAPNVLDVSSPGYSQFDSDFEPDERPLYPNYIGAILKHNSQETTRDLILIKDVYEPGEFPKGGAQGRLESEFIKRWRGAIRTSLVDVPEELEITVPDFDENDFYYFDQNGVRQPLDANHRIDLLFIYTKAVDEESTTIPKFDSDGNPTKLTKPTLGILKGAGVGISQQNPGPLNPLQSSTFDESLGEDRVNLQTLDGTPIMLAHPGDESGSTNGFTTSAGVIKGSFPSPDDLMNLAPALSENLETTAFPLIGQSILPLAYIRVQGAGPLADIINDDDIIDIRPFFRTTELAYNERAGLAAATPQISIANPVASEAHLEKVRKEVYSDLRGRIDDLTGNVSVITGPGNASRVIVAGDVLGGFFGPEGALMRKARANAGGNLFLAPMNVLADLVETDFGYAPGSVPYLPQWDKANWWNNSQFTGDKVCDHINVSLPYAAEFQGQGDAAQFLPPWRGPEGGNNLGDSINDIKGRYDPFYRLAMYNWGLAEDAAAEGGPYAASVITGTTVNGNPMYSPGLLGPIGQTVGQGILNELNARNVQINYVSKLIKLDFNATPWVQDYHVNVKLLNCVPLSDGTGGVRQASNVWVTKAKNYFIINVAWAGTHAGYKSAETEGALPWMPQNRNNPEKFAGFAQPDPIILGGTNFQNYSAGKPGQKSLSISPEQSSDVYNAIIANDPSVNSGPGLFRSAAPLLYPSITYEVIGISENSRNRSHGTNGQLMRQKNPTVKTS